MILPSLFSRYLSRLSESFPIFSSFLKYSFSLFTMRQNIVFSFIGFVSVVSLGMMKFCIFHITMSAASAPKTETIDNIRRLAFCTTKAAVIEYDNGTSMGGINGDTIITNHNMNNWNIMCLLR